MKSFCVTGKHLGDNLWARWLPDAWTWSWPWLRWLRFWVWGRPSWFQTSVRSCVIVNVNDFDDFTGRASEKGERKKGRQEKRGDSMQFWSDCHLNLWTCRLSSIQCCFCYQHMTYDNESVLFSSQRSFSSHWSSWLQTEKRPSVKEKKKTQAETIPDSEKPFACARKFS